ncbi:MAG: hypothetical protein WBE48_20445, partial [Xanthobacteraceae bacterium]
EYVINHAVDLFFGLQSETPENGNISEVAWRIRATNTAVDRNSKLRRQPQFSKARIWRAVPAQKIIFSKIQTGWLERQSVSDQSLPKIPC